MTDQVKCITKAKGGGWRCKDCKVVMHVKPHAELADEYGDRYADSHSRTPCACDPEYKEPEVDMDFDFGAFA